MAVGSIELIQVMWGWGVGGAKNINCYFSGHIIYLRDRVGSWGKTENNLSET